MSALKHIADYLKAHFAGHDTETLMQHFETAIEAKVEEGLAEMKAEIQALRDDLTGGRPIAAEPKPEPIPEPEPEPEPVIATDPEPADETGSAT